MTLHHEDGDLAEGTSEITQDKIVRRGSSKGHLTSYCLGFIFDGTMDRVILQLKERSWQRGKWNGIGGQLQGAESPRDAMDREFNEELETPLGPKKLPWLTGPVLDFPRNGVEVHVFFCSLSDNMFRNLKSKTDEQIERFDYYRLGEPKRLVPHVAWLVPLLVVGTVKLAKVRISYS